MSNTKHAQRYKNTFNTYHHTHNYSNISMQKPSFYFTHDANARNDIKIIRLRRQLGMEGYGIYWTFIEILRETTTYKLPVSAIDDIAFDINVSKEKCEAVVMNYGLFTVESEQFFSERLIRNMELYQNQQKRLSEGGKRGMAKRWGKDNQNGMVI